MTSFRGREIIFREIGGREFFVVFV